jgi:broad specificity phosphatase PhoE
MAPKFILVMRHAEKPDDDTDPHLSPAGQARAEKLASYIPKTFGKPDFIFAAADSNKSERPRETVEPLSKATGIPIHDKIADKDYADLANELLTKQDLSGKQIIVCWHHEHIPKLMQALGAKAGDYPDPWDGKIFNLILKLDFPASGKPDVAKISEPF